MSSQLTARPTRAAVVGCGAISLQHLGFLCSSDLVELTAVCDTSKVTSEFARDRFGAGRSYVDAPTMLDEVEVDVVHVLTPPHTHGEVIDLCIERGLHVICEKPMAPTAAEARELLDRAAARGVVLVESHNLLFNDPVLAIDELVASGRLGEVREVDIALHLDLTAGPFGDLNLDGPGVALPGGAVHDFLPHLAYLFLHYAPGPVCDVVGTLDNLSGNPRVGFDHLDALVRTARARGRLKVASDLRPDQFRLWVRGTSASVVTDFYNPFLRIEGGRDVGKRAPLEQLRSGLRLGAAGVLNLTNKVMQHGTYHGLPRMLDDTYSSVRAGRSPRISPDDVAATAQLTDQLVALAGGRS